jgi:hypothetical protein
MVNLITFSVPCRDCKKPIIFEKERIKGELKSIPYDAVGPYSTGSGERFYKKGKPHRETCSVLREQKMKNGCVWCQLQYERPLSHLGKLYENGPVPCVVHKSNGFFVWRGRKLDCTSASLNLINSKEREEKRQAKKAEVYRDGNSLIGEFIE